MYIEADDFRQATVVAKNEFIKFVTGKRFLALACVVAVIFVLLTAMPYLLGSKLGDNQDLIGYTGTAEYYMTPVSLIVIIGATLFASISLVTEFDEKTALILFTRPVKRTTIYLGKFITCLAVLTLIVGAYYVAAIITGMIVGGESHGISFGGSFLGALSYIFGCSGVATLISAVSKKSSLATVGTFIVLFFIISTITSIVAVFGGTIDLATGEGAPGETWYFLESSSIVDEADALKKSLVNVLWGAVAYIAGWAAFVRREI